MRDLGGPPGAGAQEEDVADAGLVDELLVELAHDRLAVRQHRAERPAVADGAPVEEGCEPGRRERREPPRGAVPDELRGQLREALLRVLAGEHRQRLVEEAP